MRLIAGSGRSGTTWILDSLAKANGLRPVFEPLHPYVSEVGFRYAHGALRSDERCEDLAEFLADVGTGKKHGLWTKYRRQVRWLLPPPAEFSTRQDAGRTAHRWRKLFQDLPELVAASRRGEPLFKCIRANLMLDWLVRAQGWKVVLIVRHPAAVIESELRGSWNAEFSLDRFRKSTSLYELTGGRYASLLARNVTPVEALAVRWVVENQWVVQRATETGFTVVYYEHLRNAPEVWWPRVVSALDLRRVPDDGLLARPSQQSSPKNFGAEPLSRRTGWQRALDADQLAAIQGILDQAACDLYSVEDPNPRGNTAAVSTALAERVAT
jgi:hypothetical protein